jgi:hypothetical protein
MATYWPWKLPPWKVSVGFSKMTGLSFTEFASSSTKTTDELERVQDRPQDLRHATEGVGVLEVDLGLLHVLLAAVRSTIARMMSSCSRVSLLPSSKPRSSSATRICPAWFFSRVPAVLEGTGGRAHAPGRCWPRTERQAQEVHRLDHRQGRHSRHRGGPVRQREALLEAQLQRREPHPPAGPRPWRACPFLRQEPLADQRQGHCERAAPDRRWRPASPASG